MARTHQNLGPNMRPLSELPDFKVEPGDPDPRDWTVVSLQGQRLGKVDDLIIDETARKVRYLVVDLDQSARGASQQDQVLLPVADADLRTGSHEVVARTYSSPATSAATGASGAASSGYSPTGEAYGRRADESTSRNRDEQRITRSEEELQIGKREVERGEARVGKHVETHHVSEPVSRLREEPVIERRPVEPGARAQAASDDEVRIPLKEEEVVVEKRPVVKEELIVGKRTVEDRDQIEADVRREEFDIETDDRSRAGRGPRRGER